MNEEKQKKNQNNITEDYVSFENAKLLNENGFNVPCTKFYVQPILPTSPIVMLSRDLMYPLDDNEYLCPTHQMVLKWFREIHGIIICIEPYMYNAAEGKTESYRFTYWTDDNLNEPCTDISSMIFNKSWPTYEAATDAAIDYCLQNLYLITDDTNTTTDENLDKVIETAFPIDLLTEDERKHAIELSKTGYLNVVKYISKIKPNLGLKGCKIYYDMYIEPFKN